MPKQRYLSTPEKLLSNARQSAGKKEWDKAISQYQNVIALKIPTPPDRRDLVTHHWLVDVYDELLDVYKNQLREKRDLAYAKWKKDAEAGCEPTVESMPRDSNYWRSSEFEAISTAKYASKDAIDETMDNIIDNSTELENKANFDFQAMSLSEAIKSYTDALAVRKEIPESCRTLDDYLWLAKTICWLLAAYNYNEIINHIEPGPGIIASLSEEADFFCKEIERLKIEEEKQEEMFCEEMDGLAGKWKNLSAEIQQSASAKQAKDNHLNKHKSQKLVQSDVEQKNPEPQSLRLSNDIPTNVSNSGMFSKNRKRKHDAVDAVPTHRYDLRSRKM